MYEDEDLGRKKSINDIIQRAMEERDKTIEMIDGLLEYKIPTVFASIELSFELLADFSKKINVDYQSIGDLEKLKEYFVKELEERKQKLLEVEMSEQSLLSSTVIGESIDRIEEVSRTLDNIPGKVLEISKNNFYSKINQKEEKEEERMIMENKKQQVQEEIHTLEIEKAYLRGKLEVTIIGKKKRELEEKIKSVEEKISTLHASLEQLEQPEYILQEEAKEENDEIAFE